MRTVRRAVALAVVAAAGIPALAQDGGPVPVPVPVPAPVPAPAPAPQNPRRDPTAPDESLRKALEAAAIAEGAAAGSTAAAPRRPVFVLRGLVVAKGRRGTAAVEEGGTIRMVAAGDRFAAGREASFEVEVVSVTADGVELRFAATGEAVSLR